MLTALEGTLKGERSPSPALCQSRHPTWLWGALFAIRVICKGPHQAVKGTWGRRKHSIMPKESRYELSSLWEAARQGPCKAQGCFANSLPHVSNQQLCISDTHYEISPRCLLFLVDERARFDFRKEFIISSGVTPIPVFPCQFLWLRNLSLSYQWFAFSLLSGSGVQARVEAAVIQSTWEPRAGRMLIAKQRRKMFFLFFFWLRAP